MKNSKSPEQELQEAITKLIAQVSEANEDEALKDFPFQLLLAADTKDNVKVTVRWPDDALPAQAVHTISSMLHHVASGHWKPPMIKAVEKHGMENDQVETASQILQTLYQHWGQQPDMDNAVCVPPRRVFARGEQNPQQ